MLVQGYYISISWRYHGRFNQQWCWALKMVDSLKILKVQTTTQSGPCCGSPTFNVIQRINCLFLRIASQAGKVVQFFGENPSLKRRIPPHWTTWSNFWMIWGTTIWGGSSISISQSATKNLHPELNKETSPKWIYMDVFFARMIWLVIDLPLKNMKGSWDDDIPNI